MSDHGEPSTSGGILSSGGNPRTSTWHKDTSGGYDEVTGSKYKQPEIAPFSPEHPPSVHIEHSPNESSSSNPRKGRAVPELSGISRRMVMTPPHVSHRVDAPAPPPAKPVATYSVPPAHQHVERQRPPSPPIVPTQAHIPVLPSQHHSGFSIPMVNPQPIGTINGIPPVYQTIPQPVWMKAPTPAPVQRRRPDYIHMSHDEQRRYHRMFEGKFDTLRMNNPTKTFNNPPEDSTLDEIHDTYERYVKGLLAEISCSYYRMYLIVMFFAIEVFVCKKLNFNISGYTEMQIDSMDQYDKMLIELGERYYTSGSNIPVEMRLIGTALFNALILIVVRYLVDMYDGDDNMFRTMVTLIRTGMRGISTMAPAGPQVDKDGLPVVSAPGGAIAGAPATANPMAGGLEGMLGQVMGAVNGQGGMQGIMKSIGPILTSLSGAMAGGSKPAAPMAPPVKVPKFR